MREIEADGFVTRECDLSEQRRTCFNCGRYRYRLDLKRYVCIDGHILDDPDWRQHYNVCDRWTKI